MNLQQAQAIENLDYKIDFGTLTKTAKYLLQGGNGLKVGEKLSIKKQPIGMGTFTVGNIETTPTPCVIAIVTSVNGIERSMKISLGSLNRRSYGTAKREVSGNPEDKDFPDVNVHEFFDMIIKFDKETGTASLENDLKLIVKKSENHYFGVFEDNKPVLNQNGTLAIEAKVQMILGIDK